jgi:hypothetical protein
MNGCDTLYFVLATPRYRRRDGLPGETILKGDLLTGQSARIIFISSGSPERLGRQLHGKSESILWPPYSLSLAVPSKIRKDQVGTTVLSQHGNDLAVKRIKDFSMLAPSKSER